MTRAPSGALAALVAGIAAGERLGPSPATGVLLATVALVIAAFVGRRRRHFPACLLVAAVVLLGCALTQRSLDGLAHWPLAAAVAARADATVAGTLVDDPHGTRFTTEALVRVDRASVGHGRWRAAGGRTVLVVGEGDAGPRLAVLTAGDRVVLRGWLSPLQGYDQRFRWRHAVARLAADEVRGFASPGGLLMRVANSLRETSLRGTRLLPRTERALVAGFLLGDTRELPADVVAEFRASGLSHLLVVSGENVAFVLALVGPVSRRLPRTARLLTTLGVLVIFGAMTRWEPSVLRACVMAACAVVSVHLGRPSTALRRLAIAAAILLAVDPLLVHSVAFQLSCGASLGIALLAARLAGWLRGPAWLRESVGVSAAAQLGVAPVLLAVFGSIPLVALPANLLAVPIAGALTVWGLAASAAAGPLARVVPDVARLLQVPSQLLADGVLGVADAASRVPLALDAPVAVALSGATALAVLGWRTRMLRRDAMVVPTR